MSEVVTAANTPKTGDTLTRSQWRRVVWVLDVAAGRRLRWGTELLEVIDDEAGSPFRLMDGLEVSYKEAVSWFGGADESQVDVSGLRPPPGLNLAALAESGIPFDGSPAELSVWDPESPWSDRVVKLRGLVVGARLGGVNEPISFGVRSRRKADLPKFPSPDEVVSVATWDPDTLPSEGQVYPTVFGFPGVRSDTVGTTKQEQAPGTRFGSIDEKDLAGGSPAYVVIYEGEKTGASQGEYSGVLPAADTDPARVIALAMSGHAFNATGNQLNLLRRYDTESVGGGVPGAGGLTFNVGRLSSVTQIQVSSEDLAAQSLDGYSADQFIGTRLSVEWVLTVGGVKKATYTIDTAVAGSTSWSFGVSYLSRSGDGFPVVGNDFRLVFNLLPVVGTSVVDVINVSQQNSRLDGVPLTVGVDDLGRPVTTVELTRAFQGSDPWVVEDQLWVIWAGSQGALAGDRFVGPLRGAGAVAEYVLRRGGVDVDVASWDAIAQELDAFSVDTYTDEPMNAWEYVSTVLLGLLPVGIVFTPAGIAPVLWRSDVTEADAVGHVVAGLLGVERRGQPKVSDEWSNEIRVRYRPLTSGETYGAEYAVIGETLVTPTQHPTTGVLRSAATRGRRDARLVDTVAVFEQRTAIAIASWLAARFAAPSTTVTIRDKQGAWSALALGSVVMFSDSELGWSRRLGVLTGRRWSNTWSEMVIDLHEVRGVS